MDKEFDKLLESLVESTSMVYSTFNEKYMMYYNDEYLIMDVDELRKFLNAKKSEIKHLNIVLRRLGLWKRTSLPDIEEFA